MTAFTIKDLENLSGIKAHTIRVWEQRYSLLQPQRTDTNIRYYSNAELQKILNISLLNRYGYKISHIDRMSAREMEEKVLSLPQAEAQKERVVNKLINFMVEMDMDGFERLVQKQVEQAGIEKTILQTFFPFLERIGILWLTHHINPAQEHLVSNIIRQKLIVAIDGIRIPDTAETQAVLFLPEGEYHEIGLLFVQYLLKRQGVSTWYLGANVPLKDLAFVTGLRKYSFLFTHVTSLGPGFHFEKFVQQFKHTLPDQRIVVSGPATQSYKKEVPSNFELKRSLSEVLLFLNQI